MQCFERAPASRVLLLTLLCLTPVLASACGEEPSRPSGTATLRATLVSPEVQEGAAVLELVGPGLANVGSAVAQTFSHRRSGDTLVVVLVAANPKTLTFTVDVPDAQRLPEVRVLEVAGGDDELRTDLSGYRVEFER